MDAIQIFLAKIKGTKFESDMNTIIEIKGKETNLGYFNLAKSVRDLKSFVQTGKKPAIGWKISDIKKYYGLKGNKVAIMEGLQIYEEVINFCEATLKELKDEELKENL